MTNIFPTNYTPKATPDWTDVVWSSDAIINFNLTIASIALYTMTNSTTDDLPEWATNKYYSDALVDANTTVIWKADKTNVLELDNTTSFTPDQDFEPATKKYVDDSIGSVPIKGTDPEVDTWTDTTKYAALNQLLDFYGLVIPWTANTYLEANAEKLTASTSLVTLKELTINRNWCFQVNFDLRWTGWGDAEAQIFRNWEVYWLFQIESWTSYVTQTENLAWWAWDTLTLRVSQGWGTQARVENLNMKYDIVNWVPAWVVVTD